MRVLLPIVIIMGVLIVVALVVVVATFVNRLNPSTKSASPAGFGTADVAMPAGCQVLETVPAADRLILRLGTAERCNQVIIVDMATGRLLGRLNLVSATQ